MLNRVAPVRVSLRLYAVLLAFSLLLAACGDSPAEEPVEDTQVSTTDTQTPTDDTQSPSGETGEIVYGLPSEPWVTDVPGILALEALAEEGWDTETIAFDSPDILMEAIVRGDVHLSNNAPLSVFNANLAGADLRMISMNNKNDLLIVSTPDIDACEQLDGQPVAYHSEGTSSTVHLRAWFADTCPEAEPDFLLIAGSANRAAALLQGEIAATIVRVEDWIPAIEGNESQGKILANLIEEQDNLLAQHIVTSADRIAENPEALEAFLNALSDQHQAIYEDPAGYAIRAAEVLNVDDPSTLASIYVALAEMGVFPVSLGVDRDNLEDTITFYEEGGSIPAGELTVESVADFTFGE